jgi:hypothetical protein
VVSGLHPLRNWPNQGNAISGRIPSGAEFFPEPTAKI